MNKQRFIKLLHDYENISDDDRNKLHELARDYPYSQVIHSLVAKANHDAETDIADQTLHYAAMYTTDRSILKKIIHQTDSIREKAREAVMLAREAFMAEEAASQDNSSKEAVQKPSPNDRVAIRQKLDSMKIDEIREEIWLDLKALKESKASYLEHLKSGVSQNETTAETESTPPKVKTSSNSKKKTTSQENNPKTKVSRGAATKPEKDNKTPKEQKTTSKSTAANKSKKPKTTSTKKNSSTSDKKQGANEQKELIDKFINKEPSITAKPLKTTDNQPDLSAASTAFNEDLVSENLAHILVNQGKKNKAIDIYKKLIWKFPQKKAYFASRIEELQK